MSYTAIYYRVNSAITWNLNLPGIIYFTRSKRNVSLICTASRMRLCFSSQSEPGIWTYIYASLTNKENMMSILRHNTIYKYKLFNHQNVPEINFILHFLCFNVEKNCNFSMGRFVFFECTEHITKVVYGMLYTTSITV